MGVGLQESILRAVLTHGEVEQRLGADREPEGWEELSLSIGGGILMVSIVKLKRLCRARW